MKVCVRAEFVDYVARHRHSKSVYTSCFVFIMFKKIENPTASEMLSVIRFLNAKNMKLAEFIVSFVTCMENMKPVETHRQLCDMYGEHATSSSVVRGWCPV